MDLFERINAVPWQTMYHSYGTAHDVPDMLRGLLSPDKATRDRARGDLLNSLDHQGVQRWDSTALAVPFLLEMVHDPLVRDRHMLLLVLAEFAIGSVDGYYLYTGFNIEQVCTPEGTFEYGYYLFQNRKGSADDIAYGKRLRRIYDAVSAGLPVYLKLVSDRSKALRMHAAHLLAWLTHAAGEIVPVLLAQFEREHDSQCRASQGLALSYVTLFDTALHAQVRGALEAALARAEERLEKRLLGIAALMYSHPSPLVRNTLLEALRNQPEKGTGYGKHPWWSCDTGDMLLRHLLERAPSDWKADVVAAGCACLRQVGDVHDALYLGEHLLGACFPALPADQVPMGYDSYRPVTFEALNDTQVLVLRTFADTPLVWHFGNMSLTLNSYGLPVYRDRMQKFLAGEGDVMRFRYPYEHTEAMPEGFFARLRVFPWQQYRHGWGTAEDLPDMLRALLSSDPAQREKAREKLHHSLNPGGEQRIADAVHVVPFLRDMLAGEDVPDRHLLLALLADVAVGNARAVRRFGYESEYYPLVHGFSVERDYSAAGSKERGFWVFYDRVGSAEDLAYGKQMHALYEAVRQGVPQYVALLDADDARLRAFAAFVLGWMTTAAGDVAPPLLRRLAREGEPRVRASLALALCYVTLFDDVLRASTVPALETALASARERFEVIALALALLRAGSDASNVRAALMDAVRQPPAHRLTTDETPWARLDDTVVLLDLLFKVAPSSWREELTDAGCTLLTQTRDEEAAESFADALLRHQFKQLDSEERMELAGASQGKVKLQQLNPLQKRVMHTIVEHDPLWDEDGYPHLALLGYGFPGYRDDIRAFLAGRKAKAR